MQGHMQKWYAWVKEVHKEGNCVSGEPMTDVQRRKTSLETSYIASAGNQDEAVEIAPGIVLTLTFGGSAEIRQVMKMHWGPNL